MVNKVLIGAVCGMALGLAVFAGLDAGRYIWLAAPTSSTATQTPLREFAYDPNWVKSGKPVFRNGETVHSPDGRTISGVWSADGPSTFEWTFYSDETVHLLEGSIDVNYLGHRFTMLPGSTSTFHAGTKAIWHVPQYAKKAYTAYRPVPLVMLWRRLFAGSPSAPPLPGKVRLPLAGGAPL